MSETPHAAWSVRLNLPVARLGARLLLQCALGAEVTEFLGRDRYPRSASADDAREGSTNGYRPLTIKTTAGPLTLSRPKLRGTTQQFTAATMQAAPSERARLASGTHSAARLLRHLDSRVDAVDAPSCSGVTAWRASASTCRDEFEEVPVGERRDVEVVVVGAGLAGLVAAAVAARSGASVVLCDVRAAGGRARSDVREGFVLNQGPHALYRAGVGADVLGRLGVHFSGSPPHPVVLGYTEATGKLARLPTSAGSLLRSPVLGLADKARFARLLGRVPKLEPGSFATMTAAEWIASLGLTTRGAGVISALTRVATYAGDLDLVSADAAVAQLKLALQGVIYLDGGWQSLVDGLEAVATSGGVRLLEGERATELEARADGTFELRTPTRALRAASVVVATGSPAAARALLPHRPAWKLGAPATAACLDLGLRRVPATMVAYGLDQPLYLSTHSPKAQLAPPGGAVVHVMRYGVRASTEDRAQLWALALRCGISDADVITQRFLHEMTVCHALPRPGSGLGGRPAIDATGTAGVFIAGDWVGPVGLLADASLASGEAAGRAAVEHAQRQRASDGAMVGR